MQIIDFDKKGNVVRFYLGEKTAAWGWTNKNYQVKTKDGITTPDWLKPSDRYYGDDWDDRPYEHNAGTVYPEFIKGYIDIAFNFGDLVLEPSEAYLDNSPWCKDDMADRKVPCIIVIPQKLAETNWSKDFNYWVGAADGIKYYFGDVIDELNTRGTILHQEIKENI